MDVLSLKGFLTIAALGGLLVGVPIASCQGVIGPPGPGEVALTAIGSLLIGLLVAAGCYLAQLARELRALHLPAEELLDGEGVVDETRIAHCRTGRPLRFWDAVGGKLVRTTHRLIFLAHRGQPWHYRVTLSLDEIAGADSSLESGTFPGSLRVRTHGGKQEVFLFGAVRELEADRWAAAILLSRHQAHAEARAEDQLTAAPPGLGVTERPPVRGVNASRD